MTTPPDWTAPESLNSPFYGDLARLFRLLALADSATIASNVDISLLSDRAVVLNHAERRMAQLALLNLLKQGARPPATSRITLLRHFIGLHPLRAIALGYRALRNN